MFTQFQFTQPLADYLAPVFGRQGLVVEMERSTAKASAGEKPDLRWTLFRRFCSRRAAAG